MSLRYRCPGPSYCPLPPTRPRAAFLSLVYSAATAILSFANQVYFNDTAVLDTKQTPYAWVFSFVPNPHPPPPIHHPQAALA
ncbi:hypothetical protein BC937DRAFT_93376 [Endogone sp. FLAS-F59071]|nr:hypothetical protein BC937DRAFT_93376 [Endogone sp. FLAS-F59071]|eukprot:RUS21195.1 hypothetical protein BC937DRAFT_93376 [Endogone sp. FLAS-F59071]